MLSGKERDRSCVFQRISPKNFEKMGPSWTSREFWGRGDRGMPLGETRGIDGSPKLGYTQ